MNILFELSNCDSALQAYVPVVESLRKRCRNVSCSVLSVCEFFGLKTDTLRLRSTFDEVYTLSQTKLLSLPFLPHLAQRLNLLPPQFGGLWTVRKKLRDIIQKTMPCVIVVANDRRFPEYDLVFLANRAQIPVLLLQESIRKDMVFPLQNYGRKDKVLRRFFHYEQGNLRHGQGGCTRISAWGKNGVEYFRAVGVSSDRIAVVGSPRIDAFVDACRSLSREKIRGELGIPAEVKVVLFATNPLSRMKVASLSDYLEAIRTVINLVDRMGRAGCNVLLLLKPHRLEIADHNLYGILQACEISPFVHYLADTCLETAIVATDAVLVFNSTVAVEAALMAKPVGIVNFHGWEMGIDFVEHGLAVELRDEFSLEGFARGDRDAKSQQMANVEHYVRHIGSSAERITDEIILLNGE